MEAKSGAMGGFLPECWSDDVRMNSLFAPFRKRSVNPLDWDSKLKFWKSLIDTWCSRTNHPVFTVAEATKAFERNGRRALCLPDVVLEIIRSGEGCRVCDFERGAVDASPSDDSSSWLWWAVGMAKKPVSWAAGRIWGDQGSSPAELDPDERIIMLSVLKKIADSLVDGSTGELVDLNELQKSGESKENLRLAVLLLERRGLAKTTKCGQRTLVKVVPEDEVAAASSCKSAAAAVPSAISEVERSAFVLRKDEIALQKNIEKLEEERALLQEEARMYVRKGMRQLAKSSLKKRHELEKCIEKRVTALENVQSLLHRVKEAETDGQVLESYKMGVAALKNTFKEAGLTEDSIENTRNELEEVMELHGDLTSTLADLGKSVMMDVEGEEDLEEELAELLGKQTSQTAEETSKTKDLVTDNKLDQELEKRVRSLTIEDLPSPPDDPLTTPPAVKAKSKLLVSELLE